MHITLHRRSPLHKSGMGGDAYSVSFKREGSEGLRAHVVGERTLANTIDYWEAILDQVCAMHPRWLFVCDELRGDELSAKEWQKLVEAMVGRGLEGVRIAHVKPHGLDHIEYCEIYARKAGLDARAFVDGGVADRWLRYGTTDEVA